MPRILRAGALYHVTARINRKEMVLDRAAIKELLLGVIKRAKAKYSFRVDNFSIMGNHIHLIIKPAQTASLSRIMQWILGVFAMAYNRLMGLTGHVWGERFRSRIVDGLRAFMKVFKYIDGNPVTAGLASDPKEWRFGGLWHHRTACRDIVDPVDGSMLLLFPEHGQVLIPAIGVATRRRKA